MKYFILIVLFAINISIFSQERSGILTYQITINQHLDKSLTKELDSMEGFEELADLEHLNQEQTLNYTTVFTPEYYYHSSGFGMFHYNSLKNRKTGEHFFVMKSDITKTVQFSDLNKADSLKKEESKKNEIEGLPNDDVINGIATGDTIITHSNETMNILGYNCKKVTIEIEESSTITCWYTDEIPELNDMNMSYPSVNGFALSTIMDLGLATTKLVVNELAFKNVDPVGPELLQVPDGYTLELEAFNVAHGQIVPNDQIITHRPGFIDFRDQEKLALQTDMEIQKFLTLANKDEVVSEIELTFFISDSGKLTEITTNEDLSPENLEKLNTAIKKMKRLVKVKPVRFKQNPVPAKLSIRFYARM